MHLKLPKPFFTFPLYGMFHLIFTFYSCAAIGQQETASKTYNYNKPVERWVFDKELKEVSGIQRLPNGNFLAIEDNSTHLYTVKLLEGKATIINTWDFSEVNDKKTDIEDVLLQGNKVYAIKSDGTIYFIEDYLAQKQAVKIKTELNDKNDVEGLAVDPKTGNLLLACKGDMLDKKADGEKAVYSFDLRTNKILETPFLLVNEKKIYPSAIAIHPQSNDIYVLSARGKPAILVYSYEGKLKYKENLDRDLYPQPEGICFGTDGSLYISTEGDRGVAATLYRVQ